MDDSAGFKEVLKALKTIGISPDVQQSFFEGVAAVLHIGNTEFAKNGEDSCKISNMDSMLRKVSQG